MSLSALVTWAQSSRRGQLRAEPSGYELVFIPGGTLLSDSVPGEANREGEMSNQLIALDGFFLGKYPVTNEEYRAFMNANPGIEEPAYWNDERFNQSRQPVVGVSWDDACRYCEWAGLVLPTEAQWEYACRAGSSSEFWAGDGEGNLVQAGWFRGNSDGRTHPVGQKRPNAFGLYDLHGNVWEWCQDWFGPHDAPVQPGDGLRLTHDGCFHGGGALGRKIT